MYGSLVYSRFGLYINFSENKATLSMAIGTIQRWALTLGAYSYTIQFGKEARIPMLML